jgi:hypothetical protein|tara:strand:+ start:174 stop:545 length:372 start_codon:yes stop_codon:yes gene_type:complete
MDESLEKIFKEVGIPFKENENLDGQLFPREIFLDETRYENIQDKIVILKEYLSSSSLTCLQDTAPANQRWPLLNLIRQLLRTYKYSMEPIRKSDGYDKDGKKRYKRYFKIKKIEKKKVESEEI